MREILEFSSREDFRKWLWGHYLSNEGVWLLFGKAGGPKTVKASEALELQIKEKEGERILKSIKDDSYVIALAIEGKMRSSEELAARIEKLGIGGESHLTFVIGGSLGLAPAVLNRADEKLSFSPMTFPHQLMRVILLEQIYRSYRIINHEPYHK